MKVPIKVFVLMGNDFPDGVYSSRTAGEKAIRENLAADKLTRPYGPGIHYRLYEFIIKE